MPGRTVSPHLGHKTSASDAGQDVTAPVAERLVTPRAYSIGIPLPWSRRSLASIVDEGDVANAGEKLTEYFEARKQRAKLKRVK
jgi:hypothetical protein